MTRLVQSVKSFTVCPTFHTACDIGDGLIFLRRFFRKRDACSRNSSSTTVYMRKYLCYLFQKESSVWSLVHLKKNCVVSYSAEYVLKTFYNLS